MEQNTDRMGFALIALSVVAFVLLIMNTFFGPTVKGFFNGFNDWQTAMVDGITETTKQDVTHTAYSWSRGASDFTTNNPNLNLLDGTKDFGNWENSGRWSNDGIYKTYKGLTIKSYQRPWDGMFKKYIAPQDGLYTWSSFVKSDSDSSKIFRVLIINNKQIPNVELGSKFEWRRDFVTVSLKKGDDVIFTYGNSENNGGKLSVAGYKLERGSTATPYMPAASELKSKDIPKYIGTYTDKNDLASQDPKKYTWTLNPDYHE